MPEEMGLTHPCQVKDWDIDMIRLIENLERELACYFKLHGKKLRPNNHREVKILCALIRQSAEKLREHMNEA